MRCEAQHLIKEWPYVQRCRNDVPEGREFVIILDGEPVHLCATCFDVLLGNMPDGLFISQFGEGSKTLCRWYLLCENQATKARTHPILGEVPICDRCDALVEAIEGTKK